MPKKFNSIQEKRTYQCWADMKHRCNNPNNHAYDRYGGRGISVCERWGSYENFVSDMGLKPDGLTLDRINNNGNYEPGNCRWISNQEQCFNQRVNDNITFNGVTKPLKKWADELGMPRTTLRHRIHEYGWSVQEAMTISVDKKKRPRSQRINQG